MRSYRSPPVAQPQPAYFKRQEPEWATASEVTAWPRMAERIATRERDEKPKPVHRVKSNGKKGSDGFANSFVRYAAGVSYTDRVDDARNGRKKKKKSGCVVQ